MDSKLQADFEAAAAASRQLPERPDNATLLKLYALYKQATDGDAAGDPPGAMDFVGRAKWNAWAELQGRPREDAARDYIALVESLGG